MMLRAAVRRSVQGTFLSRRRWCASYVYVYTAAPDRKASLESAWQCSAQATSRQVRCHCIKYILIMHDKHIGYSKLLQSEMKILKKHVR